MSAMEGSRRCSWQRTISPGRVSCNREVKPLPRFDEASTSARSIVRSHARTRSAAGSRNEHGRDVVHGLDVSGAHAGLFERRQKLSRYRAARNETKHSQVYSV